MEHNEILGMDAALKYINQTLVDKIGDITLQVSTSEICTHFEQGCGSALINADPDPAFFLIADPDQNPGF